MDFVDMNVSQAGLAGFERKLGFSQVYCLACVAVNSKADISKKLALPCAVESQSVELLMSAAKARNAALVNPFPAKDFEKEPKLFRRIADEGKALEIPLSVFLESSGGRRAGRLHVARRAAFLCKKFGVPAVLTSRARDEKGCRSPYEMICIGTAFLGLEERVARDAVSRTPAQFALDFGLSPL